MNDEYSKEQQELFDKPVIVIMPSFNDEWVVEVQDHDGRLQGRFNAPDADAVVASIRAALMNIDGPAPFDVN